MVTQSAIICDIEKYVAKLLESELPEGIEFHCLPHTQGVVAAVQHISREVKVAQKEEELLTIAAWFHDTGFTREYSGHEWESTKICQAYLESICYHPQDILKILGLITATKYPQKPETDLQKILCDSDLFHLSQPHYWQCNQLLRNELDRYLGKCYTDKEWYTQNFIFLKNHTYWTKYGQTVLEKCKYEHILENLDLLQITLHDQS